jgi:hypothetical protein
MALTDEQKAHIESTFRVSLDDIGEGNYTVYNLTPYQGEPIGIQVTGAQLFSTEIGGRLIVLAIHNEDEAIEMTEDCLLVEGYGD